MARMKAKEKKPLIKLSAEDLLEFNLRRNTLNYARFLFLMVEEAQIVFTKNLRTKYSIPTTKFEIHPETGVVTPKEDKA